MVCAVPQDFIKVGFRLRGEGLKMMGGFDARSAEHTSRILSSSSKADHGGFALAHYFWDAHPSAVALAAVTGDIMWQFKLQL